MLKQELAKELSKPIIIKFENRKAHSSSKDNLWGTDLTVNKLMSKWEVMQLISKYTKGFQFLFCAIDAFSKYT